MASTFRAKNKEIEERLEELRKDLQKTSGDHGINAALNYAVKLGHRKMEELNGQKSSARRQKVEASTFQ
jgi:predicted Holliday junction resolvase-like endonuclease